MSLNESDNIPIIYLYIFHLKEQGIIRNRLLKTLCYICVTGIQKVKLAQLAK